MASLMLWNASATIPVLGYHERRSRRARVRTPIVLLPDAYPGQRHLLAARGAQSEFLTRVDRRGEVWRGLFGLDHGFSLGLG